MTSKMASRTALTSILEAPGLDFGSSRSRFWTVLGSIFRNFRAFLASCLRNGCFTDTMPRKPKSGQIVAKMWAFISPCAFSTAVLRMQAFKAWQSPKILAHKWGGGGGPPLGEFNPPPTEGVQGVLDHNHIAYNQSSRSITNGQAPDGKLKFLL